MDPELALQRARDWLVEQPLEYVRGSLRALREVLGIAPVLLRHPIAGLLFVCGLALEPMLG